MVFRIGLTLALLFTCVSMYAQVQPVGTVDGTVSDGSGAMLASVKVTLRNVDTGLSRDAQTNEMGYYFFPLVNPGRYEASVEKAGFKRGVQEVTVRTGIRATADFALQLGAVTDSVQVTAESPLLETSTAAVSRNITHKTVTEMPLLARNVLMLVNLAPGITNNAPTSNTTGLIDIDSVSYTSASGANNRTNEFLMDGIPNNVSDRVAYIPSVDDVEEFTVSTNALDAEYGHGGGMYVNVVTKGGTNSLHGNLYNFFRNDKLNANSFFSNAAGAKRPVFRFNQYGLTAGGPIVKNKTFWFFNFEGLRQRTPRQYRFTVPTALQRTGDFSQTFNAAGVPFQIADPSTTTTAGARTLFPGNRIPANRLNAVARNVISRYPAANLPGDTNTGANNYFSEVPAPYDGENYSVRIDQNVKNHRIFGRWSTNQGFPGTPTPWDIGEGGVGALEGNNRAQTSIGLSDVMTLSPTLVITAQGGFTRWTQEGTHPKFDQTTLGIPASLVSQMQQDIFPRFNLGADAYYIGSSEGRWYEHTNTFSLNIGVSKNWRGHNMKFGYQSQVKQNNSVGANRPGGEYNFDRAFTQPSALTPGNNLGNSIASFLLGTPASGLLNLRATTAPQAPFYGWYFQDDYKLTSKLSLNLGLRYDLMLGVTERYDQSNLGFDLKVSNPIEAAAKTAYAANPIPELSPSAFTVRGGLFFATKDNRRNVVADKTNWQPRIGLAYRILPKTVIRTGFGIFYSGWWQPFVNTTGFAAQTDMVTTLDGGFTPADTLGNPFPNGFVKPTGASLGLTTLLGQVLNPYDYERKNIRNDRWSFGVQHEVMRNLQFEINYVGQRAPNLITSSSSADANKVISAGWNGSGGTFDQKYYNLGTRLNARTPNPFLGLIPAPSALAGATITVAQLLNPYPSFGSLTLNRSSGGKSNYHSLQMSGTQRLTAGAVVQFAYTFSKQIETMRFIEPSDPAPAKMIGQFDNPHRVSAGIIYEIPIGKIQNSVMKKVVGGWQWSAMYIYQTGAAVALPAALATGVDPKLEDPTITKWFNGGSMAVLPAFTARRIPYFWTGLRVPAINNWDMGFNNNTYVYKEKVKLQFRAEMINTFNRVWFGGLNTTITAAQYTQLTSQANTPRNIQLGLKLSF